MGDPQHRLLLRVAHHSDAQREAGLTAEPAGRERLPLDGFVVPALLLLVAREIHLHDPIRVLAWRLLHGEVPAPSWLAPLLPAPSGAIDRDPLALALASLAMLTAIAYAVLAPFVRVRWRAALLGVGTAIVVLLPSMGLVSMGLATGRPFGQDGGVVQLPLAMDRLLAGQTPYGADYSDSMLGKQARVSAFWREYGGNPILRHHAYLPGTHLLMLPGYLAGRALFGAFDARAVTLVGFALCAWLAFRFPGQGAKGLVGAALVLVNPLVWWHQVFGANDVLVAALLLGSALALDRGRAVWAGALLGLACATKQLAWPYAPFLLAQILGATSFRDLGRRETWARSARPLLAAALVFVAVVAPVVALGPRAFWGDIVAYNVGLAGGDAYPLGGTPGFGFANLLIYFGAVGSLKDHVSFAPFYLLLVPLGLLMLRRQMRERSAAMALVLGSVALVASLYFSRVVHPNYLVLAAILLPIGCLARGRDALLAIAPLCLLAIAVEYAQYEVLRTAWEQAVAYGASGFLGAFGPRATSGLTVDPLGALVSALTAGVAVLWLATVVIPDRPRIRFALVAAGAACAMVIPTALFVAVGRATDGPIRGQDAWLADVAYAGETPLIDEAHPPRVREAWSSSFRQDPPAALLPATPYASASAVGSALRRVGLADPRPLYLCALAVAAWIALRFRGALSAAVILVSPGLALGLALGAPDAFVLAGLVAASALALRGRAVLSGGVAGVASVGTWHVHSLPAAIALIGDSGGQRRVVRLALAGLLAVLVLTLGGGLLLAHARAQSGWPALGLGGLLVYGGAESSPWALGFHRYAAPIAWLGTFFFCARRIGGWFGAAILILAGLWLWGSSALWLGAPVALLALGAIQEHGEAAVET